jgi:hypothetical protein
MKTKIGMALGSGLGTAIYEAIKHGFGGVDWTKVMFVTLVSGVIFLLIPKSVFEKKTNP